MISNNKLKFQENSSSALEKSVNWVKLFELSSSSEIDIIIKEGEVVFKKNSAVGLTEVSKMTDSAISKRQGDQRKNSFLEKKILHKKEKLIHYEHPEISHHLMDCAMKQPTHQFHKILFHISRYLGWNAEKTPQL